MSHERSSRNRLAHFFKKLDESGPAAALNKLTHPTKNVDDHAGWKWSPPSPAVQSDLRGDADAQASLLQRARRSIGYILPLLDGLTPLRVDADRDVCRTTAIIVRMSLLSIMEELNRPAGPRVQRLDRIFEELLGVPITTPLAPNESAVRARVASPAKGDLPVWMNQLEERDSHFSPDSPTQTHSLLRELRDAYGLYIDKADTIEDEQTLCNASILFDLVVALRGAWIGKRAFFNRNPPQSIATMPMGRLSRQLGMLAASVREAYAAMDAVHFGEAERDATEIHLETVDPYPPLTVGELLEWVEDFATNEGPALLESPGKQVVLAFHARLYRLTTWVEATWKFFHPDHGDALESVLTDRVTFSLREIHTQLKRTAEEAGG